MSQNRISKELDGGFSRSYALAFSPDGRFFASGGYDQRIRLWDAKGFALLGTLEGHTGAVFSLEFSSSSDLLVSGSRDHTVRVWTTDTLENRFIFRGHEQRINSVGFLDGGHTVVSAGYDSLRLWPLDQCTPVRLLKRPGYVFEIYFADEKRLLYVEGGSKVLRQLDLETLDDQPFATVSGEGRLSSGIAISSIGHVATRCENGPLELWDFEPRRKLAEIDARGAIAFSENGEFLFCGSDEGLHAWAVDKPNARLMISPQSCSGLVVQGNTMASYGPERTISIWKCESDDPLQFSVVAETEVAHQSDINGFDLSPDGTMVATCSGGGGIKVWDATSGEMVAEQTGTKSIQYHVLFSQDGNCLFSTGNDSYVTAWNVDTLEERFRFPRLGGGGTSVAISPSGRWLASSTFSGEIRVWEIGKPDSQSTGAQ